jgi:hypothetical protein
MSIKGALVRTAVGLGGVAVLGTAVIGVAHTPWGRPLLELPLLSAMAKNAGCPVGSIEPAAFEQVRTSRLRGDAGTAAARSYPALTFVLGETHRPAIEAWAKAERCKAGFVASVLECDDVMSLGAPAIAHLRLQFDGSERLVSVDLFRNGASALVDRFQGLSRDLDQRVGPATSTVGTPSMAFMKSSPLQTVVRTYSYKDYLARATLLNFGKLGLRLREEYQWLPAPPPA